MKKHKNDGGQKDMKDQEKWEKVKAWVRDDMKKSHNEKMKARGDKDERAEHGWWMAEETAKQIIKFIKGLDKLS